jgi:hypothetical protein
MKLIIVLILCLFILSSCNSLSILDVSSLDNTTVKINIPNKEDVFCLQGGNCTLNSITADYSTIVNATVINYNITNLNVNGNASFTGNFETNCLHCEDGDVYFHGDGFFTGNVTAPNIEVMESLIVHGNSTCTGTAIACEDIYDIGLCGWTTWLGQRGCRWVWGSCIGTATTCEEMGTALCEEQHVCSLTLGSVGFTIGGDGLDASEIRLNGTNINNIYVNVDGDTMTGELTIQGNLNVTKNIYVSGCIKYNCSNADGCITLGSCI